MRCCAGAACWTSRKQPEVKITRRLALLLLLLCGSTAVQAHPHVWITSVSELLYAPDGSVTGVRHAWTFDDMFSTYALQGIETKQKGVYTREELAPLAKTNAESLKEFSYFTFVKADGKRAKLEDPIDYFLDYSSGQLTLHFTLPLQTPLKSKMILLEIVDRSYFIDFRLAEKEPLKLVNAPEGCKASIGRPMADRTWAQGASEDSFKEGGSNVTVGLLFYNKITVDCP
jgi:ABC-type uncharacterized transport system substrate-binding protein